ncbi:DUF3108 domain-containing protein [Paraflavisolibacter sp. H34]|uniref:DUF3108 domain-containing protein n=1 Tax=Huijunlia imazamoxiresistens TaxID=3127457 RepID=UPI003018AE1D
MKKFTFLLVCFLALFGGAHAQQQAFQAGEKITFSVFYNVIGMYLHAGTASFHTQVAKYNNRDVYHVVGEGATNPRYDWIFKVRDRYESFFNTDDLESVRFIRHVNEGKYKKHEEVHFNAKENTAVTSKGVFKVPEKVLDVINCLYFARNINYAQYKEGDKIPFSMFLDDEVYSMYIRYAGKQTISTKYGTFRTIVLKPLLLKGNVFQGGEQMTVWISDDPNHVPVRIESDLSVGSVKVDMMKYQNLKHPLSALIKVN